jgi:hypothetical protein
MREAHLKIVLLYMEILNIQIIYLQKPQIKEGCLDGQVSLEFILISQVTIFHYFIMITLFYIFFLQ